MNEVNNSDNVNNRMPEEKYVPEAYRYKGNKKQPVEATIKSFLIMLLFIAVQVVVMLLFMLGGKVTASITQAYSELSGDELYKAIMGSVDTVALTAAATFISMIVAILWYKLVYCKGYKFSDFKKTCKRVFSVRSAFGIVFLAVGLFYVVDFVLVFIEAISPQTIEDYNKLIEAIDFNQLDIVIILLTVIIAPINEEFIMRGIIFTKLKKNMSPIFAAVISAILFGVFHMNIVQGIYASLLGLAMAYLAYKYQSIVASIFFHAIFNGLNYLLLVLPECFSTSYVLRVLIPIVTGVLWYFLEGKKKINYIE